MTLRCERTAPAKLNLALHVVGQRQDGRHLIESLAAFTRTGDRLVVFPADHDEFEIEGPFARDLRGHPGNLVLAARDLLRASFPSFACPPVHMRLEKNLPVAAGIGGGSSDAAAALKILAGLWQLPVEADRLAAVALTLGADLPMCLAARPLLAGGIGELIRPVPNLPLLRIVLVNPGIPVATARVFQELVNKRNAGLPPLPQSATLASWLGWLSGTRNDLEAPALRLAPDIGRALGSLSDAGAAIARMSGSGATCYGIFAEEMVQHQAAKRIGEAHPDWFVTAAETAGHRQ